MLFNVKQQLSIIALLFIVSCGTAPGDAQVATEKSQPTASMAEVESDAVQVIQFHSEHRCMTCNKIEALTRETLTGVALPFSLVNVDDDANEAQATAFEAAGTALYLYHPRTGAKQDLTDFAFMNASNEADFKKGLSEAITTFQNEQK